MSTKSRAPAKTVAPAQRSKRAATPAAAPQPASETTPADEAAALPLASKPLADAVAAVVALAEAPGDSAVPATADDTAGPTPSTRRAKPDERDDGATQWTKQVCRMTHREYVALGTLKKRAARGGSKLKRGEVLRLGLVALSEMSDAEFRELAARIALVRKST